MLLPAPWAMGKFPYLFKIFPITEVNYKILKKFQNRIDGVGEVKALQRKNRFDFINDHSEI